MAEHVSDSQNEDRRAIGKPGLQLYTVRSLMEEDVAATVAAVAEIGYEEVEFAGFFDHSAKEIAGILSDNGLTAPSCHISLERFRDDLDGAIEDIKVVGSPFLVCAWIPEEQRQSLDDFRRIADEFNEWGRHCREADIQFAFHNHDFEFRKMDGELPFDVILERGDPDLVKIEMDLFWIRKGGFDPAPYFERYPDRFPLVHVKDMAKDGEMTEVGSGKIDFASDFSMADIAGIKHYFVEHDNPVVPLDSIRKSYAAISRLLGRADSTMEQ